MATKQITTWDEFKTALTETITENTTYEIANDIDISSDILTARINCVSAFNKTFNGNDHKINGITIYNSSASCVFYFNLLNTGGTFSFNQIHFSNFQCTAVTGGLFYFYTTVSNSKQPMFNNCYFNGECRIFAQGNSGSYGPRANFNNCSLYIGQMQISLTSGYNPLYMQNCYIIIKSLNNWSLDNSAIDRPLFNTVRDCYIGGETTISMGSSTSSAYRRYLVATTGYNSVVNIDLTVTDTSTSRIIYLFQSTSATCLFNNDKYTGSLTVSFTPTTPAQSNYKLTDEQMKDASYIASNTTFPISA